MSDYSAIARSIGEKLSYKCRVNFCTEQEYKCGQTILVTATAYGEEVREEATVDAVVYVNRTRETEEIDFTLFQTYNPNQIRCIVARFFLNPLEL